MVGWEFIISNHLNETQVIKLDIFFDKLRFVPLICLILWIFLEIVQVLDIASEYEKSSYTFKELFNGIVSLSGMICLLSFLLSFFLIIIHLLQKDEDKNKIEDIIMVLLKTSFVSFALFIVGGLLSLIL